MKDGGQLYENGTTEECAVLPPEIGLQMRTVVVHVGVIWVSQQGIPLALR